MIELHAGPERSVAATKTYTAQLTVMALLAAALSGSTERLAELRAVPEAVSAALAVAPEVARRAERYRYMQQCVILGRGFNYATVFELALKLKELTYVMANAYSSADFRHGPIATVDDGLASILIMPRGATFDDMLQLTGDLKARGAELLVVSDDRRALDLAHTPFELPGTLPEWLSPLIAIVPGQLLALHLALAKGYHPDTPRGLSKVTKTL